MKNRRIFSLVMLILLVSFLPVACKGQIETMVQSNNGIIEVNLFNSSSDTLYVFDSYYRPISQIGGYDKLIDLMRAEGTNIRVEKNSFPVYSRFLHRYDVVNNEYIINLMPLPPYLSFSISDLARIGENRVRSRGNFLYSFQVLAPKMSLDIPIPKDALAKNNWVYDINISDYNTWDREIIFLDAPSPSTQNEEIVIEFAIYRNIDFISSVEAYCSDELEFNNQLKEVVPFKVYISRNLFDFEKE